MKTFLLASQIKEEIEVCHYCMEDRKNKIVCCGENHFERAYVTDTDECFLVSEVELINDNIDRR